MTAWIALAKQQHSVNYLGVLMSYYLSDFSKKETEVSHMHSQ